MTFEIIAFFDDHITFIIAEIEPVRQTTPQEDFWLPIVVKLEVHEEAQEETGNTYN